MLGDGTDCDVIALAEDQLEAAVQVFYVRGGRVRGQRGWVVDKVEDITPGELVEQFLGQVYGDDPVLGELPNGPRRGRPGGPGRGLRPGGGRHRADRGEAAGAAGRAGRPAATGRCRARCWCRSCRPAPAAIEEWLAGRRGGRVSLRVPQRGDKKTLLDTVARNAAESLALHKTRRASDLTTRSRAMSEIQDALGLDEAPLRIECYDVSNLQGTHVVASMIVFEDGLARKSEYRRFSIRGLDGTDDVASIHEVISRRFRRYLEEREATGELDVLGDPAAQEPENVSSRRKFAYPPNLVVIDGGPAQVAAAARALDELGIDDVVGLRAGQAAGGGLAARRGQPGDHAAHERGPVPAAAGQGRGAPVRDHLSPEEAGRGAHHQRAGRRARAGPGAPGHPAAPFRLRAQARAG